MLVPATPPAPLVGRVLALPQHSERLSPQPGHGPSAAGLAASGLALCSLALAASVRRPRSGRGLAPKASSGLGRGAPRATQLHALPEAADFARQAQELWAAAGGAGDAAELVGALQQWADSLTAAGSHAAEAAGSVFDLMPPAHAADAVVLDPNVQYIYGSDGNVLIDPMSNKPITDDWWNGLIGLQAGWLKGIDGKLRELGVEQAFGWTIVLYTCLVKTAFYPLQQSQVRNTSMMQLLSPKVKEIQERYKNDPEALNNILGQLYSNMDVSPLGGCLPLFLQIPLFWSLYGVWRRLSAEKFPHYDESFLWVPSLAQPNPDFQFKADWLFQFKDGAPVMGWEDYLSYLVFPALLVGFTLITQQQAQASKPKAEDGKEEDQNLVLQVLPFISVYFIGTLSLELPQAVSVYYLTNSALSVAQTALVKYSLRQEIPGYEEFERTGKFPDSAFEDALKSSVPAPKTLHEAALRGQLSVLQDFYESSEGLDIDAWDEKDITPLGYAVACGHLTCVKYLVGQGANLQKTDGQDNSMLHYAAGYGHQEVLEELLEAGDKLWPKQEWSEWKNKRGQTVMDAARVNRKGGVVDFLSKKLGIEVPAVVAEVVQSPTAAASTEAPSNDAARARAALLAAAAGSDTAAPSPAAAPAVDAEQAAKATEAATAMRTAVAKLKENPAAVEQARKMMAKMPPGLLSMMSGNKLSEEQAKKAMDAMQGMSTEDLLERATGATELMEKAQVPQQVAGKEGVNAGAQKAPARAVD